MLGSSGEMPKDRQGESRRLSEASCIGRHSAMHVGVRLGKYVPLGPLVIGAGLPGPGASCLGLCGRLTSCSWLEMGAPAATYWPRDELPGVNSSKIFGHPDNTTALVVWAASPVRSSKLLG